MSLNTFFLKSILLQFPFEYEGINRYISISITRSLLTLIFFFPLFLVGETLMIGFKNIFMTTIKGCMADSF